MGHLNLTYILTLKTIQAFYLPDAGRSNLKVLTSALVTKILTKKAHDGDLVATGVEFVHGEQKYAIDVAMEVILCAGYVASTCFTIVLIYVLAEP